MCVSSLHRRRAADGHVQIPLLAQKQNDHELMVGSDAKAVEMLHMAVLTRRGQLRML
jgi:hypothetical protein